MKDLHVRLEEASVAVREKTEVRPWMGLILGSGLGALAEEVEDAVVIPYGGIPHMPTSTVSGHSGNLVIGHLEQCPVAILQGRIHLYEGYTPQEIVFPLRLMAKLGIECALVTNAAGGINPTFKPGNLMIIVDHINLMFRNPLIGPNDDEVGPRFPDMTQAYDPAMIQTMEQVAQKRGIGVRHGIYMSLLGPSYETPAEIRMLRSLGGDAVGMSTVPEVVTARHMGLRVGGISCITNLGAGLSPNPLSHGEVETVARESRQEFMNLVRGAVGLLWERKGA